MRRIDRIKREIRDECSDLGHDLGKFKCMASSIDGKYRTYVTTCKKCKGVVKIVHGEITGWWFIFMKRGNDIIE